MRERPAVPARSLKPSHLIAAFIPLVIVVLSVTGFVWAQKGITVVVDGESHYMKTQVADVATLLSEADISISEGDVVTPSFDTRVVDGMTVVVRHAVPVTISLADEEIEVSVIGRTVADALVAAGVAPGSGVLCEPSIDAPLEDGMEISVQNVFVRVVEETGEVPFETVTESDATLAQGSRKVVTEGVSGEILRVYRVVVLDGEEGERTLEAETIVREPVAEVIAVGTKRSTGHTLVSRSRPPAEAAPTTGNKLTVVTTAYAPNVDGVGTRTATGARAGYGIIAVDPKVIPLGTKLYVPGYGYGVAADTGGAIKGNKIDLCFDTRAECISWGRRTITITILD